jgi:hypothetical protein
LVRNLSQADSAGADAKQAVGENSAVLSEKSFNVLSQAPSAAGRGDDGAVKAGPSTSSKTSGLVSGSGDSGVAAKPVPKTDSGDGKNWDSPRKGFVGFENGFKAGAVWVEEGAFEKVQPALEGLTGCQDMFCMIDPVVVVGTVLTAVVVSPVALVAGLGRGLWGSIFGAKEY